MRNILALAAMLFCRAAFAQTPALVPPVVTMPMPAPSVTITAGQSLTLTWAAVTEDTVGMALSGAVTYNVWGVETGTAVKENSGLTTATVTHTGMTAGIKCYVITASVAGDIDSPGSTPPFCVNVAVPIPQVAAPTGVTGSGS